MRNFLTLAFALAFAFVVLGGSELEARNGVGAAPIDGRDASAFDISVTDTDVDNAWSLLTHDNITWTQLTADDELRVHPAGSDSVALTITGLKADSTYTAVTATFGEGSSTTGTGGRLDNITWYAVESWWIQDEHSDVVDLEPDGSNPTSVSQLAAGELWQGPAQVFFGAKPGILERVEFAVNGTDPVDFEVRIYPDFKDVRDTGDGYYAIGPIRVDDVSGIVSLELNKRIGSRSVVQVWANSTAANNTVYTRLVGSRRYR